MKILPPPNTTRQRQAGFSLMELAVVLMIIGTLMSGILVAVSQSTANARITNAKAQLRNIEDALYGYAQTNGRLPCPATNSSSGLAAPVTDGTCTVNHGFVPASTLGLYGSINSDGLLLDPWQNPIRYSVASNICATCGANRSFTSTSGLDTMFNAGSLTTTDMLRVCDTSACSGVVYADQAPAVILSMGANWASYTAANEEANAGDGTTQLGTYNVTNTNDFVYTTYSEDNFDDQIVWLSPHVLFNKLVSAGKLP